MHQAIFYPDPTTHAAVLSVFALRPRAAFDELVEAVAERFGVEDVDIDHVELIEGQGDIEVVVVDGRPVGTIDEHVRREEWPLLVERFERGRRLWAEKLAALLQNNA